MTEASATDSERWQNGTGSLGRRRCSAKCVSLGKSKGKGTSSFETVISRSLALAKPGALADEDDPEFLNTEWKHDEEPPKFMVCDGGCRRTRKRTFLYPTIDGIGWQGSLFLHCQDCFDHKWSEIETDQCTKTVSNITSSQWNNICKKKWEKRQGVAFEVAKT